MIKRKRIFVMALAFLGAISSNHASAGVITFNGLAGTSVPGADYVDPGVATASVGGAPLVVNGFSFSSSLAQVLSLVGPTYTNNYDLPGDASGASFNGTDYMVSYSNFVISRVGGGAFSLNRLDLDGWVDTNPVPSATVIGHFAGGGSITQTLALNTTYNSVTQIGNDFTSSVLTGFNDLSSVTIDWNTPDLPYPYYLAMDNVDLAPVPEPASLGLLGLGLAGLGFGRRRTQQAA